MSKLFRPFSPQNETSSISTKESSMRQSSRNRVESSPGFAEKPELAATNLNSDVQIKGSIRFNDSLRLDGQFEGELHSDSGLLIIGKNGSINATITVGSAIVEGEVNGNIIAKDKIELRSTAQLFGDIKAGRLVVEEGVVFVGKCDVNPQQTIEPIRPEATEAKTQTSTAASSIIEEESDEDELQEDFLR